MVLQYSNNIFLVSFYLYLKIKLYSIKGFHLFSRFFHIFLVIVLFFFKLFYFRSPLLIKSRLFFFPQVNKMFQFTWLLIIKIFILEKHNSFAIYFILIMRSTFFQVSYLSFTLVHLYKL